MESATDIQMAKRSNATDLYWDQFVDYAMLSRKKSNFKFKLNMEEIQSMSLNFVPLDAQNDPPLPDWAKRIVFESHLSKRTKLLLLQYHDKKVRMNRLHTSSIGETTNNTEKTEYADDESAEGEE